MLRQSYGAGQLPHTRERPGIAIAGAVARALLAVALLSVTVALLLLTRELASWRSHVPDVMAQSTAWQRETSDFQEQTAQLQPKIDAALQVTRDVVSETERVRRSIPPMLREIERAGETVRAVLPRVDEALQRIDGIEQALPEVLKTANDAVTEVKRANDSLPGVMQEVRETRTEAEQLVAHAERVVEGSRKAGREASEGAVAGVFTGVFKLPFTSVVELRRERHDRLSFEKKMTDQDRELLRQATSAALADPKDRVVYPWRNDQTHHSGTLSALRTYTRKGRHCREISYVVQLDRSKHGAHVELYQENQGSHAGEWQVTGVIEG